ncbi:hypothetical protein J5N97_025568 [Dioscorea zingiberensis]|uniref:Uncharacterized protein n=1 Tax=Dioscorea zingiberensis TaxID=325984 RepID=A0A9D5C8H9_9LILI|nr:hypothetical protein J5N97_025568 [Dioscorea zingiberensis]
MGTITPLYSLVSSYNASSLLRYGRTVSNIGSASQESPRSLLSLFKQPAEAPTQAERCYQYLPKNADKASGSAFKESPPQLSITCNLQHATGWFSRLMMKLLGLRVKIRFQSTCPPKGAADLLKPASELFDRIKKLLAEFEGLKSSCNSCDPAETVTYSEPNVLEYENEDQEEPINCDIEDEEEEGEEEEQDGYDSPPMPSEDDHFFLDANSYQVGDDFLQDLLRGFPLSNGFKDQQPKNTNSSGGSSDEEYHIYEQDSDDNDNYYDYDNNSLN